MCAQSTSILAWVQAIGLPTLVVGLLAFYIGRWQVKIARENQRRDQYDRRFAIYMSFHELLLAITEKDDAESEFRKANAMRAQAPFLLNAALGSYLTTLLDDAFRLIQQAKRLRSPEWSSREERDDAAMQLPSDRLAFTGRIDELAEHFVPFLRMKDL
jgi:hypothetical protein